MTGQVGKYTATLDCLSRFTGEPHTVSYNSGPPFIGDTVFCLACREYSTVVAAPYEWRSGCRSCGYNGTSTTSKTSAHQWSYDHRRTHPSHSAVIRKGGKVHTVLLPLDDTLKRAFAELLDSMGYGV
jgi:hypothetical protein